MNFMQTILAVAEASGDKSGVWASIKSGFIFFLEWLHSLTVVLGMPSWVLAIFFFTLIIRILTQPLMNKQMRSTRKMQLLAPEVAEIKKRYATNPQKMQAETMKLYKEHGASPTAGCLPLLIQMPILWALFDALRNYQPADLTGFSFMWIPSLGQPDPTGLVLPLLAAGATFLQQWVSTANRQDRQQRMMLIMMPAMFFFFVRNFQSLLAFYWIFYSLIGAAIYYPILKKWEKEDRRKIEEIRRAKEEEEEARRAKKAAAREAAKKKPRKADNPAYAVEEDDFADDIDDMPEEDEDQDAEQDPEKLFRRHLAEEGIRVKKKKMRLHPYSAEDEIVEICIMPDGKERMIGDLRREFKGMQQQQAMPMDFGSLFGFGKKKQQPAKKAPAQQTADKDDMPPEQAAAPENVGENSGGENSGGENSGGEKETP